jgi:hypothetical protein
MKLVVFVREIMRIVLERSRRAWEVAVGGSYLLLTMPHCGRPNVRAWGRVSAGVLAAPHLMRLKLERSNGERSSFDNSKAA